MLSAMSPVLSARPQADFDSEEDDIYDSDDHSLPIFSPAPSMSSYTSYDVSMRSASPTPSVWSVTSSLRAKAFKIEYGRGLNNYSEVYRLPADDEELARLDKQHDLFKEIMGKYPPPLAEVMADNVPGEMKACLDLGCGSASWIIDVAQDFPNCSAVAVDLVPIQDDTEVSRLPPNCRSEVDDINLGLEHYYGDFDVVHTRLISSGIKNYSALIHETSLVLRAGGLLDVMEFDFRVYDQNHQLFNIGTESLAEPWWPRWMEFANMAVRQRGGDVDAANHLHHWISRHPAFEDAVYREFWIPCSPWMQDDEERRIGSTMRDDILAFIQSGRPLLLGSGLPESLVNELEERANAELHEARWPQYIRVQNVYARRKHDVD